MRERQLPSDDSAATGLSLALYRRRATWNGVDRHSRVLAVRHRGNRGIRSALVGADGISGAITDQTGTRHVDGCRLRCHRDLDEGARSLNPRRARVGSLYYLMTARGLVTARKSTFA